MAIIKAENLVANNWLPIRLAEPAKIGEEIVTIGNPTIEGHTVNTAVSKGIVSQLKLDSYDTPILVADITVSSGSSGGPLISTNTMEILGVVVSVARPGLNKEGTSSSGYWCLTAPAVYFDDWLGIEYEDSGS